jgi:S-adenosylhomocysteine hydrolase
MDSMLKDPALADQGRRKIAFARKCMPVLQAIAEEFEALRPLEGVRLGACLHVTTETANLVKALVAGGADVAVCASNPLSTKDDQTLAVEYLIREYAALANDVHDVPADIDQRVARMKLQAFGIRHDEFTPSQRDCLTTWKAGT